jgi:hypothetical protein
MWLKGDSFPVRQGEVAAGLRIEFEIAPELTGLVIGKKVRKSPPQRRVIPTA